MFTMQILDDTIWIKFRKRAEELQKKSNSIREVSKDEKERIFKERAEKLSLAKADYRDDKTLFKFISFYVAGELFGIEVKYLKEVYEYNTITRIPCTSPVLSGLINYRGTILSIINLNVLFKLQKDMGSNEDSKFIKGLPHKILILEHLNNRAGVVIDRFDSLIELSSEGVKPVSSFFQDKNKIIKYEASVNNTPLLIIDTEGLLNDERLIINEEV